MTIQREKELRESLRLTANGDDLFQFDTPKHVKRVLRTHIASRKLTSPAVFGKEATSNPPPAPAPPLSTVPPDV